jgi:hypothetical protein
MGKLTDESLEKLMVDVQRRRLAAEALARRAQA